MFCLFFLGGFWGGRFGEVGLVKRKWGVKGGGGVVFLDCEGNFNSAVAVLIAFTTSG